MYSWNWGLLRLHHSSRLMHSKTFAAHGFNSKAHKVLRPKIHGYTV